MDKYEYKRLVEQIQSLIDQGEYAQAADIADRIDWRRVKSVMTLGTISDLYKINGRYEDARDIMLLAYDRKPENRQICYSLCELYIKTGEPVAAAEFYKEFEKIAPKDPGRYVLKYKLYDAYDVSLDEKIEVLEKLKEEEYQERWMYELASLYHRRGLGSKCVEVCDEIILWFGSGKYVNMAMELKMLHEPLTPEQQKKYDARNQKRESASQMTVIPEAPREQSQTVAPEVADQRTVAYPAVGGSAPSNNTHEWETEDVEQAEAGRMGETRVFNTEEVRRKLREQEKAQDEFDIQVKTVDVSQYNTMNLQAEIAEGLKEILERQEEEGKEQKSEGYVDSITRVIPPVDISDSGPLDMPVMEEADEEDLEEPAETHQEVEASESAKPLHETAGEMYQDENGYFHDASEEPIQREKKNQEENALEREALTAQPPESMAKVLTQEADGQLRFVVPESKSIEKQITGQISIDDIRAEWEKMKQESQAKQEEEVRQQVLRHTGKMFTEFEEAMRDNILKQMEDTIDPTTFATPQIGEESESDAKTEMGSEWDFEGLGGMTRISEDDAVEEAKAEPEKTEETEVAAEAEPEKAEEAEVTTEAEAEAEAETEPEAEPEKAEEAEVTTEAEAETEPEAEPEKAEEAEVTTETASETEPEKAEEAEVTAEATSETEPEKIEEPQFASEVVVKEVEETKKTLGDVLREDYSWGEESLMEEEFEEASKRRNMFARRDQVAETMSDADGSGIDFESLPMEEPEEAQEEESFVKRFSMDDTDEEFARINDGDADDASEPEDLKEEGEDKAPENVPEEPVIAARALSAEEEKLFDPWIRDDSDKEQLARAIDTISMAAYTGNVVITGELGLNTVGLAKKMIYAIKTSDSNFSGKVAKVNGGALVKTDVIQLMDGLKNGALIVEDAGSMPDKAVQDLHKCMQRENWGIVVFLLDTKKSIKKFFKAHEELRSAFNARVNVKPMSNDALAGFAKQYARDKEFSIDNLGMLALHMKIDEMQTARHAVNTEDMKEVMDDAIESASRKTIGHFFDILLGRRYDEEDMIIITEKDFE